MNITVADFYASADLTAAFRERRIRVWFNGVEVVEVEVLAGTYRLHRRVPGVRTVPPRTVSGDTLLDVEEVGE